MIDQSRAKSGSTSLLDVKKYHGIGAIWIERIYSMHTVNDFAIISIQIFVV